MADIINPYTRKQQLSEGVYVMEDGNRSWGGEVNHNFELLNTILAKKTLTLTQQGKVLGTFDARLDTTIDIPSNKNTLTLTQNGKEIGKFDNSEDKTFDIKSYSLGIKYGENIIGTFDNTENLVIEIPETGNGVLTLTLNGKEIGSFRPYETKTIDLGVFDIASETDIDMIFD